MHTALGHIVLRCGEVQRWGRIAGPTCCIRAHASEYSVFHLLHENAFSHQQVGKSGPWILLALTPGTLLLGCRERPHVSPAHCSLLCHRKPRPLCSPPSPGRMSSLLGLGGKEVSCPFLWINERIFRKNKSKTKKPKPPNKTKPTTASKPTVEILWKLNFFIRFVHLLP